MADRRMPYARTLAVLRVLSLPYRYPPLSWVSAGIDWLAATPVRAAGTVATSGVVVTVCALIVGGVVGRG